MEEAHWQDKADWILAEDAAWVSSVMEAPLEIGAKEVSPTKGRCPPLPQNGQWRCADDNQRRGTLMLPLPLDPDNNRGAVPPQMLAPLAVDDLVCEYETMDLSDWAAACNDKATINAPGSLAKTDLCRGWVAGLRIQERRPWHVGV